MNDKNRKAIWAKQNRKTLPKNYDYEKGVYNIYFPKEPKSEFQKQAHNAKLIDSTMKIKDLNPIDRPNTMDMENYLRKTKNEIKRRSNNNEKTVGERMRDGEL